MKLVTFVHDGRTALGALLPGGAGTRVLDLNRLDPRLPAEYRSPDKAIREGTEVMAEAMGRYDALPAETQALLLPFLLPPYYQGSWDDQQPAEGGPLAAAPLTLPAAAALAPGGPPEMPLSDKWFYRGNAKVKVWGRKDRPGDGRLVELVFNALKDKVWPDLPNQLLHRNHILRKLNDRATHGRKVVRVLVS